MPIVISIPDDCKSLVEPIEQLVASVTRSQRRADGGRSIMRPWSRSWASGPPPSNGRPTRPS
jgi:hypothetical protein